MNIGNLLLFISLLSTCSAAMSLAYLTERDKIPKIKNHLRLI